MRCSDHAGSRAARAVALRGGFRAAGRTQGNAPDQPGGGQADQGRNRLTGKQVLIHSQRASRAGGVSQPGLETGTLAPVTKSLCASPSRNASSWPERRPDTSASARKTLGFPLSIARDPSGSSFGFALKKPDLPLVPGGQPGKGPGPVLPAQPGHRRQRWLSNEGQTMRVSGIQIGFSACCLIWPACSSAMPAGSAPSSGSPTRPTRQGAVLVLSRRGRRSRRYCGSAGWTAGCRCLPPSRTQWCSARLELRFSWCPALWRGDERTSGASVGT